METFIIKFTLSLTGFFIVANLIKLYLGVDKLTPITQLTPVQGLVVSVLAGTSFYFFLVLASSTRPSL